MVRYCSIKGCTSTDYKKAIKEDNIISVTFFGFPKNPFLREKWVEFLISSGHQSRIDVEKLPKSSCICSLHFAENCIETNGFSPRRLKPDSVPTILLNAPRESTANTETKSPDIIMKENIDQYEKDISDSIDECTDNIFENVQCDRSIYETPSKNRMCYAGDIKSRDIEEMSSKTLIKSMKVLKKSCDKKDKIINRLRVQHCRQKKKIESLETLLHELRTKNLLSSTSSDIIKV